MATANNEVKMMWTVAVIANIQGTISAIVCTGCEISQKKNSIMIVSAEIQIRGLQNTS
jgi:hypothetical protein